MDVSGRYILNYFFRLQAVILQDVFDRYFVCFLQFGFGRTSSDGDDRDIERVVFSCWLNFCFMVFAILSYFPFGNGMEQIPDRVPVSVR